MAFAVQKPWLPFVSSETFVKPRASKRALACASVSALPVFGFAAEPAGGVAGFAWAGVS